MGKTTVMSVSDFIGTKYREYWAYSNKNGKNSIEPREGLPEVVRKIIYAAYKVGVKEHDEHKTIELKGEVAKYHAHGDSSIEDSIKGVATAYKSQPATRVLEGVGNFGSAPGDEGAAARYTGVSGTPLLTSAYRDIPFVPFSSDDTGLEQPDYISLPLPMALINGQSAIGTGKSCYVAERDANEVVQWIRDMFEQDDWTLPAPAPMSVTGCVTWIEPSNGYVYYEAVVHEGVDMHDVNKKGKYDVITALPPKQTPANVIAKLVQKLPTRVSKQVVDGSGRGKPTWIIVPHGYLKEADYTKYGLRTARKEQIYLWDEKLDTMKSGELVDLAKGWFEDRCEVVTRRLQSQIADSCAMVHRVDLIKEFAEHKMIEWKAEDVIEHFMKLFPETGEEDGQTVLGMPARTFLPENVGKNEVLREKELQRQEKLKKDVETIGEYVLDESFSMIEAQEKFFIK